MPQFLYTVLFLTIVFWYAFISYIFGYAPDGIFRILIFTVLLFLSLSTTLSVPFYFYLCKKAPTFTNLKFLYRKGLSWGSFISFGFISLLIFKGFNLFNPINLGLFTVLYLLIFLQIKGKR